MDNQRTTVEGELAEWFGYDHCVLVGRATTGITLVLQALTVPGDEVLYPAYTCVSPVYSAVYADLEPGFVDVRQDYTIDTAALRQRISTETAAVVPIHMFGHAARIETVREIADEYNALVVEDACQSIGTQYNGELVGSFGDVSVLSFGEKKPIDAGGGGAILTDQTELARQVRSASAAISTCDEQHLEALYNHYRDLYYQIEDLKQILPAASQLYRPFPDVFKPLYHRGLDPSVPGRLSRALNGVNDAITTRREHASIYRSELSHPSITHPEPLGSPVYYRYSVCLESKEMRDFIVASLRDENFHVSTLYDTIHHRFGQSGPFNTAADLSSRTMNLWVSPRIDAEYVKNCAHKTIESIAEFNDECGE